MNNLSELNYCFCHLLFVLSYDFGNENIFVLFIRKCTEKNVEILLSYDGDDLKSELLNVRKKDAVTTIL